MAQASRAYDLELFQPRKPHLVELKNNAKATEDNRRRNRRQSVLNLFVYLAVGAVALALAGYFITMRVRMTEINKSILDMQAQYSALVSEEVRLKSEIAGLTSAEKVNAYVQDNGMNPINSNQIYYIEAIEEDRVSIPEVEGNWFRRAWNAVVDFVS